MATKYISTRDCPFETKDGTVSRRIAAANWFREANRRLHGRSDLPSPAVIRKIVGLQDEITKLRNEISILRNETSILTANLTAFEQSTSWRVTRPLRWLKRIADTRPSPVEVAMPTPEPGDYRNIHPWSPETSIPPQGMGNHNLIHAPGARGRFADFPAWIAQDEAAFQSRLYPAPINSIAAVSPRVTLILTAIYTDPRGLAANLHALHGCIASFALIVVCDSSIGDREMLEQFVSSLADAKLVVLPEGTTAAAAKAAAISKANTDFIGFLDLPDRIAPAALRLIGEAIAFNPESEVIFADEDYLDKLGQRCDPFFKPGWDPELHQAGDLFGPLLVLRRDLLHRIGLPPEAPHSEWFRDLGQRAVRVCRSDAICHIPAILCHRPTPVDAADRNARASARWKKVPRVVPTPSPLVSVIVPTKDRAELLRTCTEGLLHHTAYPELELVILDNGTREADAIALLQELEANERVRILPLPEPFNWSSLNNSGARAARGDILVLLNNDIRILRSDWLDELVVHAIRPEVGAVGAKLLYPNGTLEHAGVVIANNGIPGHVLRSAPANTECLNGMLSVEHSVSIVTGACLAVRRATFFEVGALDEGLAVACNDVDFCLRLMAYGYRNIWTPFAVLEHLGLATRGPDRTEAMRAKWEAEVDHLWRNWYSATVSDRYFNPNLDLVDEQPVLRRWQHVDPL